MRDDDRGETRGFNLLVERGVHGESGDEGKRDGPTISAKEQTVGKRGEREGLASGGEDKKSVEWKARNEQECESKKNKVGRGKRDSARKPMGQKTRGFRKEEAARGRTREATPCPLDKR